MAAIDINLQSLVEPDTGSTTIGKDGKMVPITATASPGVQLHKSAPGQGQWDVVRVSGANGANAGTRTLTIEWGVETSGASTNFQRVVVQLTANSGLTLVIDRQRLRNGLVVRAYADNATDVSCYVEVARYSA